MAIIGLTVSESGESMQRLAVTTKVAIGEVVKMQDGKSRPNKLDHFIFLRKNARSLDWEVDGDLAKHYGAQCREIWIVLLTDELENVFRTEYAWWAKTEKKCWGDGKQATRRTEKNPDGEDWTPCGDGCPDLEANRCKPSGDLYFVLADFPRLGSVCRIHTTSYRSVRQIYSALEQIRTVTGGRLAGIRCKLVVRPEKAAYYDEKLKKKVSTTIFALNLELSAQDMQKLIGDMTQYAKLFEQTKKLLGNGRKVEYLVEEEDEEERAPDISQEFYPAEEIAPASSVQQPSRASAQQPIDVEPIWPKEENGNGGNGHAPAGNGNGQLFNGAVITPEQRKKFFDIAMEHGFQVQAVKDILFKFWKVKNSAEIPADKFEEVIRYFETDGREEPKFQATNDDIPF
jgi:recombination directionality factor gp3-like protein